MMPQQAVRGRESRPGRAAHAPVPRANGVRPYKRRWRQGVLGAWVGNRSGAVIAGAWDSWACIEQAG